MQKNLVVKVFMLSVTAVFLTGCAAAKSSLADYMEKQIINGCNAPGIILKRNPERF